MQRRPARPRLPHGRLTARSRRRRGLVRQRRSLHTLLLVTALLSGVGMAAAAVGYASYNSYISQLPNAATLAAMEPPLDSHVYARDGTTLLATFHDQAFRHAHVQLSSVALLARQATIDVEDRHFYEHASLDFPRIVKAGFDDVTRTGPVQGASTITEQLAKVSFLASSDRTFERKIKQLILGNEIEGNFTKDQILEMYLNRIPYGNHAVGIETAAELYFHKTARTLDLAEASMLAGLPNSPSDFNPLLHGPGLPVNPRAKVRQRTVLEAMVSVGDITEVQAQAAFAENLVFHSWEEGEVQRYPDFLGYLRGYLDDHYGDAYIRPGGWEIYTTVDPARQEAAMAVLRSSILAVRDRYNAHDGAIASVDPRTGEVEALVGAWDNADPGIGQLNMALQTTQPGSTIKLFTYAAAIASRQFTMTTPILDAPLTLTVRNGTPYSPLDYDRHWHGVCPLKACLGNSFNVPAVKVEAATGIPFITNLEIASGLTELGSSGNRPAPDQWSATLGGLREGLTPLDLASGAGTFGALGVHHDPTPVLRIIDAVGGRYNYTHDARRESHRVIPENVAYIMDEITSNDANRVAEFGPHGALTLPGRRVSAKTGTTESFVANWTVGWTPELATAVWVGNPDPSCLRNGDRPGIAAMVRAYPGFSDQSVENPNDFPYSPAELARLSAHFNRSLLPLNDHCGHLEGATGITGAAPIWNSYMIRALAGSPANWYPRPPDILARGPAGDDADFYLPGTEAPAAPGCIPAGPPNDPTSVCKPPPPPPVPVIPGLPGLVPQPPNTRPLVPGGYTLLPGF